MKLIVGLGNPGDDYVLTRHNIGFIILDNYLGNQKWLNNEFAQYQSLNISGEKALFIKPTTFMNLSGNAVRYFVNYYKLSVEDILIINDDLDLETGKFKLKINSSSGGHNGIQSIIDSLGSNSFLRLKIGISKPANGDTINHVLKRLSKNDMDLLAQNQEIFNNIINDFINDSLPEMLMNKYNGLL